MLNKHGIWCQTSLVLPTIMSIASTLSCQQLTLHTDMYWSFLFWAVTCIDFMAAEHGPFGASVRLWQTLRKQSRFVIHCVMATWSMTQWPVYQHVCCLPIFWGTSILLQQHHSIVLFFAIIVSFLFGKPWVAMLLYWICESGSEYLFSRLKGSSLADLPIRNAYGYRALGILFKAMALWSLRCLYRFPYTFRWTPVCLGCICIGLVTGWASTHIQNTQVSRNAIVKRSGHDIAASIFAARKCPECQSCLTALDMESSFGE